MRQHHAYLRIIEDEREPALGVGWIKRDVGSARFPGCQNRHDHVDRPLQMDPYQRIWAHAPRLEIPREPVCPSIQLSVGDLFSLANHRHGFRGSIGLLLNELMQTPRP